jgi:hypothetical protein
MNIARSFLRMLSILRNASGDLVWQLEHNQILQGG